MWSSIRGFKTEKEKFTRTSLSERVIKVRRVVKVVKGGKKLSFSAIVVLGDERGKVGVGVGKGSDTAKAVEKGRIDAYKNMVKVNLTPLGSIPHETRGRFGAADVMLKPSSPGSGVIAGGSVRAVVELAGIKNILSKRFGSDNLLNNARATVNGLKLVDCYDRYERELRKKS